MKTALKIAALLAVLGFPFSIQATPVSPAASSTLPTFHVYASDQTEIGTGVAVLEWEFQKVLDAQETVAIQVLIPGEETQIVETPGITTALVSGQPGQS